MTIVVRWLVTTLAVSIALYLVPGITLPTDQDAYVSIIIFSMFLAFVNLGIKPVLKFLTLPITILSLGLFMLVLNALMIYLAAWMASALFFTDIGISSFLTAVIFGAVVSVITGVINMLTGVEDHKE